MFLALGASRTVRWTRDAPSVAGPSSGQVCRARLGMAGGRQIRGSFSRSLRGVGVESAANGNGGDPQRADGGGKRPSVAVVGGGFGGVGAAVMLVRAGYDDVTVFERGERVGGVWDHNTYPGAACDVPSHLYEFSFEPNPRWSRRYAPQAEIQEYIEEVARRHGVLESASTGTEVTRAEWDEARAKWQLQTSAGASRPTS